MKCKLALETENEIISIGDKVKIVMADKEKNIIKGTLSNIFRGVWSPYTICLNLKELPYNESISTNEILEIINLSGDSLYWGDINE